MSAATTPSITIVGVLDDGRESLTPRAMRAVHQADLLFGGQRLLDFFPESRAEKVAIKGDLSRLVALMKDNLGRRRMCVLASGDPTFFGIAKYLLGRLPKPEIEIVPNVSSMQLAFARVKENWDDAALASVHGRPIEGVIDLVRSNRKIALFTDEVHSPAAIARALLDNGVHGYRAFVCENLGGAQERIVEAELEDLVDQAFSPLNVLILLREQEVVGKPEARRWPIGIPDDEFFQRRPRSGLITRAEVRVVALSKMRLHEDSVVWDIGAGSGSVSIEAALLAPRGKVFAIEKNAEDADIVRQNVAKFGVANLTLVEGRAPDGLDRFDDPDAVFVGGSGGELGEILAIACRRLRPGGRVVVNAVTLENLNGALEGLRANGMEVDVTLASFARSQPILNLLRFAAQDPIFIITGRRSDA